MFGINKKLNEINEKLNKKEIVSDAECYYFNREFRYSLHKDFTYRYKDTIINSPVSKPDSFLSSVMGLVTDMNNRILELEKLLEEKNIKED